MANVSFRLARWIVVVLLCLAAPISAFAQGGTGTLTGTVVDGTGAAIPGATVIATESNTGTERTVVSDDAGVFRMAALNPGRYILKIELASFRPLTVADINLLASEIRDLGKLALEIGGITETVSVTSEVTPVQVADSSRRQHHHGRRYREHPDEGPRHLRPARHPAGRAGHQPESRLRAVAVRDLDHHQRHAVAEQGRPRRRPEHRRRRRLRHGVRQPEHGRDRRSAGHRQRLHGGERPQQRRRDQHGDEVGHQAAAGRRAGTTAAATSSTRTTISARHATTAKPLYRVNISGYSVGGPVVIPGLVDSRTAGREARSSTSSARRNTPTTRGRRRPPREHADGARVQRRFLADPHHGWNHPADHRSRLPVRSSRATSSPHARHQRARPADAPPAAGSERYRRTRSAVRSGRRTRPTT